MGAEAAAPESLGPVLRRDLRALLFDLDGTLLDSFRSHLEIYQATLARFGIALDADQFRRHYTPNWNEFYRRVGLPPQRWDEASAVWLREAGAHAPRPFPGVASALRRLRGLYRLGLVTAGSRSRVHADLDRGGLGALFEVVVTADDVHEPKPAPEGLWLALHALGLDAAQALYLGDTEPDREFATAAGVPFLWVVSEFATCEQRGSHPCVVSVMNLPARLGVA